MERIDIKVKNKVSRDFGRKIDSFKAIDKFPQKILYIRISLGESSDSKSYQFEVGSKTYLCVADFVFIWIYKMAYWELGADGKCHRLRL
jgi:hypothetical protein